MMMNIIEARKFLADNGIYQLNRGESLHDALESVRNNKLRVGYKVKHDDGSAMTENQIIRNENKIAFSKMVKPVEFHQDDVEDIEDIPSSDDFRQDKTMRGIIANCHYCGTTIRVDGDCEDYPPTVPEEHCEGCSNNAIWNLAM